MASDHEAVVLQAEKIKKRYGLIAFSSSWSIHASYIVLPGTFTSLGQRLEQNDNGSLVAAQIKHVTLLRLAVIFGICGGIGLVFVWWRFGNNYVWMKRNVVFPEAASSVVGLLNTLINVYFVHNGYWSVTAKIALTMNVLSLVIMAALFLEYEYNIVDKVGRFWAKRMGQV